MFSFFSLWHRFFLVYGTVFYSLWQNLFFSLWHPQDLDLGLPSCPQPEAPKSGPCLPEPQMAFAGHLQRDSDKDFEGLPFWRILSFPTVAPQGGPASRAGQGCQIRFFSVYGNVFFLLAVVVLTDFFFSLWTCENYQKVSMLKLKNNYGTV